MVELRDVSLYFSGSEKYILRGINWHIRDGENWVLFGRNGSGKTKLLEVITGYIYPSGGEVIRFGESHLGHDIRETRRRIGYMSSSLRDNFPGNTTVVDAVISGIYASIGLYVEPAPEEKERAMELLSAIGMPERAGDRLGILSDGEKQKVLMLRAFINNPDLLILDEPAANLDLYAREDLLAAIEKISRAKTVSMIYVTHHIEEITPLFDRLFILKDGGCFYSGKTGEGLRDDILGGVFNRKIKVTFLNGRYYSMLV